MRIQSVLISRAQRSDWQERAADKSNKLHSALEGRDCDFKLCNLPTALLLLRVPYPSFICNILL
jgi:hypothetical protein